MKNINLQIPTSLHKKVRLVATEKELYMKDIYLLALNEFIDKELQPKEIKKNENEKFVSTGEEK